MKNKQHQLQVLKYQLREKKARKVKYVVWRLRKDQLDYIAETLGYEVVPYLYSVETRRLKIYNLTRSTLLKDLHHANKKGKRVIVKTLSKEEKSILNENGINYWVEKYRIRLF